MPICSVAPSGTRSATYAPMRRSTSPTGGGVGVRRDVDLDAQIDVVDVDEAVAEGARHRRLICAMTVSRRWIAACRAIDGGPQRAEAVRVGRRHVDEHRVERDRAARTAAACPTGRPECIRRAPH